MYQCNWEKEGGEEGETIKEIINHSLRVFFHNSNLSRNALTKRSTMRTDGQTDVVVLHPLILMSEFYSSHMLEASFTGEFLIILPLKGIKVCPLWRTPSIQSYAFLFFCPVLHALFPPSTLLIYQATSFFLPDCDFAGGAEAEQRRNFRSRPGCSR